MNNDRWTKIETLVEQALTLPPDERAAFVNKECGEDDALRNEIHSLLEHGDKALSFMGHFEEEVVAPSMDILARDQFDEDHRIDALFGHYHITDILGRGGMGIVYKAKDTKLDRTVALKFLPSHLTRSEKDKQRFIREAKAAAALNHSNICTIYSVEEHEGQHFISMEYIDGQTLRQKLESDGITPKIALEYGTQIAAALAEAHEKGIVHRDIKPGNIMVDSKNRIKVMDFGLAKLVDSTPITQTGTTLGTMAYMSPEQIQGRPVDHRADLFSFGVLLFEMLAGQRPFDGQYDAALTYSIVHEKPPLLSELLPDVPPQLAKLVSRLLEKDPAKRYSDTDHLAGELKYCLESLTEEVATSKVTRTVPSQKSDSKGSGSSTITLNLPSLRSRNGMVTLAGLLITIIGIGYWFLPETGSTEPVNNKIAVLPLESISSEPEDIQFTDGVHEELINRLTGIRELTVIGRSSVLGFEPGQRDIQSIGQKLGVSTLMEGTVRRIGDRLRVSVQLIDVNSLASIWSGSFDENIDDVFEIQSRIARQVADELHASLTDFEERQINERPTENPEAYRLYMLGREYLSRGGRGTMQVAEQQFIQALDLDPTFAQAWGMLAVTYNWIYWYQGNNSEYLQKMKEAADWSQYYGPNLAETYLATGVFMYWDRSNQEQTLAHFDRALEQYPNHDLLHLMTAYTHRKLGNWRMLIDHLKKSLELNPITGPYAELAYDYWIMRDYDKAIEVINQQIEVTQNEIPVLWSKALMIVSKEGTFNNFEELWDEIHPLDPAEEVPIYWGFYNELKRDWDEALRGYRKIESDVAFEGEFTYAPKQLLIARILHTQGNDSEAHQLYEQLRDEIEELRDRNPDMARYRMALAKVYSRLGEDEKAIHEAEIASNMLDYLRQNAENHPSLERHLAEIYAWSGQEELAIEKLEFTLSVPSEIHRNNLRIDPIWDPLRDNPRFLELITGEDKPYLEDL